MIAIKAELAKDVVGASVVGAAVLGTTGAVGKPVLGFESGDFELGLKVTGDIVRGAVGDVGLAVEGAEVAQYEANLTQILDGPQLSGRGRAHVPLISHAN